MEEKARIEVVGGILWRGGSFLAAQRPEGHPQAGFWEFPGGKVEPGESLEAALARELAEELSLSVRNPRLWRTVEHDYDFRSVRLHFFHRIFRGACRQRRTGFPLGDARRGPNTALS